MDPWVGKIPWRREWQPTPVLLSGESHGQRSLAGYGLWGCKESNTTEWLTLKLIVVQLFSCVRLFTVLWTAACQASIKARSDQPFPLSSSLFSGKKNKIPHSSFFLFTAVTVILNRGWDIRQGLKTLTISCWEVCYYQLEARATAKLPTYGVSFHS